MIAKIKKKQKNGQEKRGKNMKLLNEVIAKEKEKSRKKETKIL